MTFTVDFLSTGALEWGYEDGALTTRANRDYRPALFVAGPDRARTALRDRLVGDPKVEALATERWYTRLDADDREPVLRVTVEALDDVAPLAREVRHLHEPDLGRAGTLRLYNVDLAPQFRYCLETTTPPVPRAELSTLRLELAREALAAGDLDRLRVDGERAGESARAALEALQTRLHAVDPDVLVVSSADLVPLCYETAAACGLSGFDLGRLPGYDQLAGESTYESYGRVGHSAARYKVPGRAIVDTSNSFLWHQSGLAGILDLVGRSWKPIQETAWASIGNVLTAIQVRMALDRDVLIPQNKWEPEAYKTVETLHDADRGGFTFAPEVGFHEDVYEVDFASLYPRIITEYNISPDTILCDCHADRADVPGLGYNVCDERGFLADVLEPLLSARAEFKRRIQAAEAAPPAAEHPIAAADPAKSDAGAAAAVADGGDAVVEGAATARARSGALKWILVSCFGYQGYRNSKFGRIECHEAINAHARDILLTAKEVLEANGWTILHGIVDSLWITRTRPDATALEPLCDRISTAVDIPLEFESAYDWIALVPRRTAAAGALTKYFGKRADGGLKVRGIECRQRSTPTYIADCQRELVRTLDAHRAPAPVCATLRDQIDALAAGDVDPADLVIKQRVSKPREDYARRTRAVAALERAADRGLDVSPGQDVRYVVADDDASSRERVRLAFEECRRYDVAFYRDRLVRAAESVLSPLGWDADRIREHLSGRDPATLAAYHGP